MTRLTRWLGAGCVVAAGAIAVPSAVLAQRLPADTEYRSQYEDVDRYTNRSGAASPYRYETDYDDRTGTYRTGAGRQSVSGTQQWYRERDEPVPMQYRSGDQRRDYRTYDAGVYRDDEQRDQGYRFRSSAGTQSAAGTQRWYGERGSEEDHAYHYDATTERERMIRRQQARQSPYDYNVYGTERRDQQWWQREDQARYDPRYDRRYDSRYETRYQYERQRTTPDRRDTQVNVYRAPGSDRGGDEPVPFRYESQTTVTPDRGYDETYGMERQDLETDAYYRDEDGRVYRVERDTGRTYDPAQPRGFEYRTDAGWYYDEDRRLWVRVR